MNWKRGLGIGLIFVGAYITLTARVLTGAVAGVGKENLLGIFGILVFVVGVVLMLSHDHSRRSERVFAVRGLEGIANEIKRIQPDKSKVALIIDASAAIKFGKENPEKFKRFLEDYKNSGAKVMIPDYVLNKEVLNKSSKDIVRKYAESIGEDYEILRKEVKRYLKTTDKHLGTLHVIPYLRDPKLIEKASHAERAKIANELASLASGLEKDGYDVSGRTYEEKCEKIYDALMKNGLVSKGDVVVLASGISKNKYCDAFIIGRDAHLRQAVSNIREKDPEKIKRLKYIEFE